MNILPKLPPIHMNLTSIRRHPTRRIRRLGNIRGSKRERDIIPHRHVELERRGIETDASSAYPVHRSRSTTATGRGRIRGSAGKMIALSLGVKPAFVQRPAGLVLVVLAVEVSSEFPADVAFAVGAGDAVIQYAARVLHRLAAYCPIFV